MGECSRCRRTPPRSDSGDTRRQGPPDVTEGAARCTRFLIEREIPGASDLTLAELAEIAQTSNEAVASLGVPYTWVNSYVAGDKIYCVHEAEDAETILEHARRGGFPANLVSVVANEFGPQTAELSADPGCGRAAGRAARRSPRSRRVDSAVPERASSYPGDVALLERDHELGVLRDRRRRRVAGQGSGVAVVRRLRHREVRAARRGVDADASRRAASCAGAATR